MTYDNLTKKELIHKLNKFDRYIKELEDEVSRYKQKEMGINKTISEQINMITVLENIIDLIPIGIMMLDKDRNIADVNKTLINLVFKGREELIGLKTGTALRCIESANGCGCSSVCHTCPLDNSMKYTLNTGNSIFNLQIPTNLLIDDEEIRSFWVRVNMMRIMVGENKRVIMTIEDISTEKSMERLEKECRQNQQELIELKEYDRFKTQFFSTISHELKTPLNIILGIVQLLERTDELAIKKSNNSSFEKHVKMMKQNCYRLLRLVNNFIDITKFDSGFMKMNFKNHNIIEVVEDITLSVVDYLKSRDITLIFDTEMEEKIIACDVDKVERVMLNLLSNAVKFTEAGGKISVNIYEGEEKVIIKIKDTGIGIPKGKIDKIFNRFEQVDSCLRRRQEGSGIGLSLVKSIVEAHDGEISVASEYGVGSEFTIEIPVRYVNRDTLVKEQLILPVQSNVERINIEFSDIYS
ncbi:MAG: PAS domain-containing sensor histidine kinase [Clostridia bacterium]|nr:PAS domain-containing sensor histidine kinase [Clostridia bacterium]